jgi:hypothetical protein
MEQGVALTFLGALVESWVLDLSEALEIFFSGC